MRVITIKETREDIDFTVMIDRGDEIGDVPLGRVHKLSRGERHYFASKDQDGGHATLATLWEAVGFLVEENTTGMEGI